MYKISLLEKIAIGTVIITGFLSASALIYSGAKFLYTQEQKVYQSLQQQEKSFYPLNEFFE